ncbi:MAG: hypothetical protein AB1921_15045 [Thermodesulfobacteriota bacterium]
MEKAGKRSTLAAAGLLAAMFAAAAVYGFGRYGDILVDFGGELYLPWRLSGGAVLYRDIAFLKGPLASYTMAALFSLLGPSIRTFTGANLALTAASAALIFLFFRRAANTFTAFFTTAVFLFFFAFQHFHAIGIFNWVAPYSEDLTVGAALCLALVNLLAVLFKRESKGLLLLAGLVFGLILLTKIEVILAASGAVAAFFLLFFMQSPERKAERFALFLAAAAAPALAAFALLSLPLGAGPCLSSLSRTVTAALDPRVSQNLFYRSSLGLDHPMRNLAGAGADFLRMALTAAALAALSLLPARLGKASGAILAATGAVAVFLSLRVLFGTPLPAVILGRALTAFSLCAVAFLLGPALLPKHRGLPDPSTSSLAVWAVLSLLLLAKMLVKPRVGQLGFVLAMPAALLLTAAFTYGLPALVSRQGGSKTAAQALAAAFLMLDLAFAASLSFSRLSEKTFPVGAPPDRIYAYPSSKGFAIAGEGFDEVLSRVRASVAPGETLLVLPEGIMVNFLTGCKNPTRYMNFMPTELIVFSEREMLADIRKHPPDAVLVIPKLSADFGVGLFGTDPENGKAIMDWVRLYYALRWQIPRPGLDPDIWSIRLLKREKK